MKKEYVLSGILGGTFFAIPYLALGIGIAPSLISASTAFVAGSLIFNGTSGKMKIIDSMDYNTVIKNGYNNINVLRKLETKIGDIELKTDLDDICKISTKIINTLEKDTDKIIRTNSFLNYYLPITLKIIKRYNEIEKQNLTSKESIKFKEKVRKNVKNIKIAFENQLNNLYNNEIDDIEADIKVFEAVLKTDGLLGDMDIGKMVKKDE